MLALLRPACRLWLLLSLLTGLAYPLAITGLAQWLWPEQANGSLLHRDGQLVGSRLIGQPFSEARYFRGRPSATPGSPYNPLASGGSNLGPLNPALTARIQAEVAAYRRSGAALPLPVELATTSASGLDPHLSPAAAHHQVPRVARARGLPEATLRTLIDGRVERPLPRFLGEPVVNVLQLNLALDAIKE